MTTKGTPTTHRPRLATPQWAHDLLEGKLPEKNSTAWNDYVAWWYLGESTPGLPNPRSGDAYNLNMAAKANAHQKS